MIKNSLIASVLLFCGSAAVAQHENLVAAASEHSTFAPETAKVHFGGSAQFRYAWNTNVNDLGNDNTNGFSVPLARLHATGDITDSVDFRVEGQFDSGSEDFGLTDAFVGVAPFESARFQIGQFRLPFLLEQNVDAEKQMSAQTSVFSNIFGQGYSQGVQLGLGNDDVLFRAAVSDGFNTANTNFDDAVESDLSLTARLDLAVIGKISNFSEFTSYDGNGGLLIGAAAHYQDENSLAENLLTYTADVNWKVAGWSVYGAAVGRNVEDGVDTFDDFGAIAQTSLRISNFEPFARAEVIMPDDKRGFDVDTYPFLTAGVNYYLCGHAAKFTVDAVYAIEATDDIAGMNAFTDNSLISSTEEGEVCVAAQFQVMF